MARTNENLVSANLMSAALAHLEETWPEALEKLLNQDQTGDALAEVLVDRAQTAERLTETMKLAHPKMQAEEIRELVWEETILADPVGTTHDIYNQTPLSQKAETKLETFVRRRGLNRY